VTLPGSFDSQLGQGQDYAFAVSSPLPITWPMVRLFNERGATVRSLYVLQNPPSFCPVEYNMCLDHGQPASPDYVAGEPPVITAQQIAQLAVFSLLAIIQVALIAGPSFAVQLRRRQRELGLIAANGADPATMRRSVLATGVLLGLLGGTLGVGLAWLSVWLLSGPLPYQPIADVNGAPLGIPTISPSVYYLAGVGVLSATGAALVPAISAGRLDIVQSLRGLRPLPAIKRRIPLVAVALTAIGMALLSYGVAQLDAVVIGIGLTLAELGFVMLMPVIVAMAGSMANMLPLSARLAVRDAARNRMRTAAAACAIAAAAAGATGLGVWSKAADLKADATGVGLLRTAAVSQVYAPVAQDGTPQKASPLLDRMTNSAHTSLPGSTVAAVTDLVPVQPELAPERAPSRFDCLNGMIDATSGITGCISGQTTGISGNGIVLLRDASTISALLGPLAPLSEAEAALRAGKAIVTKASVLDAGGSTITFSTTSFDENFQPIAGDKVTMPAMLVTAGAQPVAVIVGPAALQPGGALAGKALPFDKSLDRFTNSATLVVVPASVPQSGPSLINRLNIAMVKAGLEPTFYPGQSQDPMLTAGFKFGTIATLLIAILATLIVTTLAQADGRANFQTLAAVGSPPALRRRIAGHSAGFVSGVGSLVGVIAGLIGAIVLIPIVVDGPMTLFRLPISTILTVLIPVPLCAAVLSWLFSRGRIVMTRRMD